MGAGVKGELQVARVACPELAGSREASFNSTLFFSL